MNNNRNNNNNNRRRGRSNNRGSGGGGGNSSNRIDTRARGNAPQMLEKYKKLASDAMLNDDRVQAEYFLQFADHYFRVIADNKSQKDEARTRRDAERDSDEDGGRESDEGRQQRSPRGKSQRSHDGSAAEGVEGSSEESGENPFLGEQRGRKPRRNSRRDSSNGARSDSRDEVFEEEMDYSAEDTGGVDPDVLPPAIARIDESDGEEEIKAEKPKRKLTRSRKPKSRDDGDEETLETVS